MNTPFEKPFQRPEQAAKSTEKLVSLTVEQKVQIQLLAKEIGLDITIFVDALEKINQKEASQMSFIFEQAEEIYNTLVGLINDFENDEDVLLPESEIKSRIEKINELYTAFVFKKHELTSELVSRGYGVIDPPTDVKPIEIINDSEPKIEANTVVPEINPGEDTSITGDNFIEDSQPEVKVIPHDNPEANSPSSAEADESREYIAALAELYRSADKRVFKVPPGNGGQPFKKLKVICEEISLVLNHEGFNSERINHFLNETVKRLDFDIRENGRLRAKEKNPARRVELASLIDNNYQELLEEVAAFLQTEKVDEELSPESISKITSEAVDIDERINVANREYESLRIKYQESGQKFAHSPSIKRIGLILDLIHDNNRETDVATSVLKKEKYLKSFLSEIEKFKEEVKSVKVIDKKLIQVEEEQSPVQDESDSSHLDLEADNSSIQDSEVDTFAKPEIKSVIETNTEQAEVAEQEAVLSSVTETVNSNSREVVSATTEEVVSSTSNEVVVHNQNNTEIVAGATSAERGSVLNEALINHYQEHRTQSLEAKKDFREKEAKYQENLKKYYENQSLLSKAFGGTRKIFGLNPKLPSELEKMESRYKDARKNYAYRLNEALEMRGFAHVGNKEFVAGSDTSKRAFGKKFILKPYQELLSVQESVLASQEANSRFKRILGTMAKHKKLTRTVGLVAVAGIGAAGGGLIGGGLSATRWAASTFGGAAAAAYTAKRMQGGVDKAELNSQVARNTALESFTLEDLDNLDSAILNADQEKGRAEIRQKAATIGTAVAIGGAAGFGTSYLPDMMPTVSSSGVASVADSMPNRTGGVLNGDEVLPNKPELAPITLKETSLPYQGLNDGSGEYQTILKDIKVVGNFKLDSLTNVQQLELSKFIKLSASDLLAAHPNISESVLETEIFEKLQAKYGNESWWKGADVSRIDIGSIEVKPVPGFENLAPSTTGNAIESSTSVEVAAHEYQVRNGDTLWSIVEKQFAEDLKDLPASKKMEILDRLFERVEGNPELKASLSLKSGDIDLIYANEKINLSGIDNELDKLLEREDIINEFKKSAPIPVEVDNGIKDIPIKVTERPGFESVSEAATASAASSVENLSMAEIQEIAAKEELLATAPRPASLSGNYFENPEYKKYVSEAFGNPKLFARIMERTIDNIDNSTYDFFSQGVYDSPYGYLKDMTLEELENFGERPNSEIRAILQINNIKYDTYLAWLDKVDEMRANLPNKPETKLSDLFSRYVAETQLPRPNNLTRNV